MRIEWLNDDLTEAYVIKTSGILWRKRTKRAHVKEGKYESMCWGWYFASGDPVGNSLGYDLHLEKKMEAERRTVETRQRNWEDVGAGLPSAKVVPR